MKARADGGNMLSIVKAWLENWDANLCRSIGDASVALRRFRSGQGHIINCVCFSDGVAFSPFHSKYVFLCCLLLFILAMFSRATFSFPFKRCTPVLSSPFNSYEFLLCYLLLSIQTMNPAHQPLSSLTSTLKYRETGKKKKAHDNIVTMKRQKSNGEHCGDEKKNRQRENIVRMKRRR